MANCRWLAATTIAFQPFAHFFLNSLWSNCGFTGMWWEYSSIYMIVCIAKILIFLNLCELIPIVDWYRCGRQAAEVEEPYFSFCSTVLFFSWSGTFIFYFGHWNSASTVYKIVDSQGLWDCLNNDNPSSLLLRVVWNLTLLEHSNCYTTGV